jgi:hypothetical protein
MARLARNVSGNVPYVPGFTGRGLLVAHTERGENFRIISARKATQRERKEYEEKNGTKGSG